MCANTLGVNVTVMCRPRGTPTYSVEGVLCGRDLLRQLVEALPLLVHFSRYLSLDLACLTQFLVLRVSVLDLAGQCHLTLCQHSGKECEGEDATREHSDQPLIAYLVLLSTELRRISISFCNTFSFSLSSAPTCEKDSVY